MSRNVRCSRSDAELLESFVARHEQAAFETLFRRYESLVASVCRGILRDEDAARDATQAVFLTLALKAPALDRSRPLAPWLHRVACDIAISHRRHLEARRALERKATERFEALPSASDPSAEEIRPILDREINGLPERYRRALILFHLEGRTLEQTASALRCSVGTVGSWLFRGRRILRDRLARRGVTPSTLSGLLVRLPSEATPGWAASLAPWTAKAATAVAAGLPAAGGYVSPIVWALARWGARSLRVALLKTAAGIAAAAAALLALAAVALRERPAPPGGPLASPPPVSPAADPAPPLWARAAPRSSAASVSFPEPTRPAAPVVDLPAGAPPRRSDLVGHWPLDQAQQEVWVEDRSGYGHRGRLIGPVSWVAGKIGRALFLDGRGSYVELAGHPALDSIHRQSFSLSAWFRPEDVPRGQGPARDASYGIVLRTGWHIGLLFNNEARFIMTDWLKGDIEPLWNSAGTWGMTYAPGHWYHLAGVVDRGLGRVHLYVNAVLKHTQPFDPSREVYEVPYGAWRIGIGNPDFADWSWPARGAIDDVRIYNRPLSPTDVRLLFAEASE